MIAQSLKTNVFHQPGLAIIELSGDLTAFGSEALDAAYSQAQRNQPERVLLNFTGVNYINSPGIGLIIGLVAQAREAGQTVGAYGLSDTYLRIFTLIGLTEMMLILPGETLPGHAEGMGLPESLLVQMEIA